MLVYDTRLMKTLKAHYPTGKTGPWFSGWRVDRIIYGKKRESSPFSGV
jgi:hypothetical protein